MNEFMESRLAAIVHPVLLPAVGTVAGLAILLVVAWTVTAVLRFLFRRLNRLAGTLAAGAGDPVEHEKRLLTLFGLLRAVAFPLWWCVVGVMMLSHVGINVAPVLAGAGIVGLAVGFGAQNLVRDVITGFFHILENQIRIGDVVRINGVGGLVERVTYRIVVIRDLEQTVHVIPHGKVETLANMTKDWSATVLDFGVAYKENADRVMDVLRQEAARMQGEPEWSGSILEPLEVMGIEAFGDSAVVIRTRFKTRPLQQWAVAREFRRRVKLAFDRQGIEFPFPHRTLMFGKGEPLVVAPAADGAAMPGTAS